jgi:hypothetical protein
MPTAEDGSQVSASFYRKKPRKKKQSGSWDESQVSRAPAGSSAGGQFAPGKARNSQAAEAQKNQKSYQVLAKGGDPKSLSAADLQQASRVAYSSKTSDPKIVALRKKIAAEMSKRGMDVKKYGALGGGLSAKKKPAAKRPASRTASKKK